MLILFDVLCARIRGKLMEQEIPSEINDHFKIFGKDAHEVDYNSVGPCPLCGSRVDEFNFCACGGNMGCD
jgi:hypothetical protein